MEELLLKSEKEIRPVFDELEEIALFNEEKVLHAFQKAHIALNHFACSNGYGYDDLGKNKLSEVFKYIFNSEEAICSPYITCGTHALNAGLFGCLKSGDSILSITGDVYDSLKNAVTGEGNGSLKDYAISFDKIELLQNGKFDYQAIEKYLSSHTPTMIYLQRSCGYSNRDTFSINELKEAISFVKNIIPNVIVFVDNCYGTFSEKQEPTEVGADMVVGSLMKNAGGGIAPSGGYIVGRKDLVDRTAGRLFGVGLGMEVGSYATSYQNYFQGVFIAPVVVVGALKGSTLLGQVLKNLGIESFPKAGTKPNDLIRRIVFNNEDKMINFIKVVQKNSPVDSFVVPFPSDMPGYDDKIIMASGGFVQGSSVEMSADGPVRPPYTAYFQGGLTYEHVKIFVNEMIKVLK